jgi:predicted house-cleaning noncanonical NTP pyrophosphatase (MazG superfamily)
MSRVYNKLVRDKIPEIMQSDGEIPEIEILNDDKYEKALNKKLLEECSELLNAKEKKSKIEEVADILEVLNGMAKSIGVKMKEIEKVRLNKRETRGGFEKKVFLKSSRER